MKKSIFSPHFVIAPDGARPYLRRWFMTPWSSDDHPLKSKRLPNIYLHQILRSDDDRALHDHPWDNISIILKGGYIEHQYAYQPQEGHELPPVVQKRRRMFSIVRRKADMPHRLELYKRPTGEPCSHCGFKKCAIAPKEEKPCWSLFITWRKRRPWGFWGTKEGIIGEHHTPVHGLPGEPTKWLTLQHKGPVGRWIHNAVFDAVQKMKG